ncbi:ankyrin repeat domain-containing protein 39 isoform X2 [Scleropages formosus]|uniref:ankyrin repeat domain-containing protein 39 isoform X2 n=1 Tax=Scleropages formosus TaxID=113540 RepID=UPI0008782D5A|nr:ankyrin repeat domain-containing protein 39 isoform X2 [Scleropages formosus]
MNMIGAEAASRAQLQSLERVTWAPAWHIIMASDFQRCACCSHRPAAPSVHQTLEEMEFERGIWSAALDGDLDRVRSFLNKGVDPNVLDQAGYTALHYASRSGSESVCALLLSQKACPNPRTKGGATPLHRAAYCGRLGVLKLLLDAGADPLLCDDDGASPLHKAAEQNRKEVCELLIQCCPALKNIKNKRSHAPYQLVQDGTPLWDLLRPAEDIKGS